MADTYTYGSRFICVLRGDADYERIAETIPGDTPEWDKHAGFLIKAANSHGALVEALRKASQLASIACDWHLEEVEIDGEMVDAHDLRNEFDAALSTAESGK